MGEVRIKMSTKLRVEDLPDLPRTRQSTETVSISKRKTQGTGKVYLRTIRPNTEDPSRMTTIEISYQRPRFPVPHLCNTLAKETPA